MPIDLPPPFPNYSLVEPALKLQDAVTDLGESAASALGKRDQISQEIDKRAEFGTSQQD